MGETVMQLIREGFNKLTIVLLCVADYRYPPLGTAIYYGTRKYASFTKLLAKKYAGKGAGATRNALIYISKLNPF